MQGTALGLTAAAVAIAAVAEKPATAAAVAMVGASALLALKFGLVTGARVTQVSPRTDTALPAEAVDTLHHLHARLDVLEDARRSENIFDQRAEKVITQVSALQFELARIDERLGTIERQLGVIGQTATPPVGSQHQRS
jgi:predicted CoA-binding protein